MASTAPTEQPLALMRKKQILGLEGTFLHAHLVTLRSRKYEAHSDFPWITDWTIRTRTRTGLLIPIQVFSYWVLHPPSVLQILSQVFAWDWCWRPGIYNRDRDRASVSACVGCASSQHISFWEMLDMVRFLAVGIVQTSRFINEETEAQREDMTCSCVHNQSRKQLNIY